MTEQKKEETLEVSKSLIESLQKDISAMKEDRDMLMQIADKKQLSNYYAKHQTKLPKVVKLRMMDGKVIMGWRTLKDEDNPNTINPRNVVNRIQEIEVVFEDKTKAKYSYPDYVNQYTTTKAKVLSLSTDEQTGNVAFKVARLDTGKEYEIDVRYLN